MPDKSFHPLADIFPMMDEAALAELAADIKAESQREPIYLWLDQIIDGRNRYAACKIAGVEPVFEKIDFPGGEGEAFAYVVSRNLKRRHLTVAQRDGVIVKLRSLPLWRQASNVEIAKHVGVSETTVRRAQGRLSSTPDEDAPQARVVHRGGQEYPMKVERIGGAAPVIEPPAPDLVPLTFEQSAAAAETNRQKALKTDSRWRQKEARVALQRLTASERQRFLAEIGDDIVLWLSEFASPTQRRRVLLRALTIEHVMEWLTACDANQWKNAYYAIDQLRLRKAKEDGDAAQSHAGA